MQERTPPVSVEQVAAGSCARGFDHRGDGVHVEPGAPRPGDFILTHGNEWTSRLIAFGQGLRFRGPRAKYAYWSHTALVVDDAGSIVEALGTGGAQRSIHDYDPTQYTVVRIVAPDQDRAGGRRGRPGASTARCLPDATRRHDGRRRRAAPARRSRPRAFARCSRPAACRRSSPGTASDRSRSL